MKAYLIITAIIYLLGMLSVATNRKDPTPVKLVSLLVHLCLFVWACILIYNL